MSSPASAAASDSWYPLNMYDATEGEWSESVTDAPGTCSLNGVQNLVEIDVRNLKRWLSGVIPATGSHGPSVENATQNGYILYFSDRRGMLTSPAGYKLGEYGFEDTISPTPKGTPNGVLDADEDTQEIGEPGHGILDSYGQSNLGLGFGTLPLTPTFNAAKRINCQVSAEPNWVSGARHALRAIDGSLGNLPSRPNHTGGFTIASETPVYVMGNYNANAAGNSDPSHFGDNHGLSHVSAAILGDKVKVLSSAWSDGNSFASPFDCRFRVAVGSWYRFAVATGVSGSVVSVVGFPSYLEDWNGQYMHYSGSTIMIYRARYATSPGFVSSGFAVYTPPARSVSFDLDFQNMSLMPPGTPSLRDVVNVGFQQIY
jgi:hypothetical protein